MTAEKLVIARVSDSAPNVVGDGCAELLARKDSVKVTVASVERLMRGTGLRSKYGEANIMKVSSEVWTQKDIEKRKKSYGRAYDSRPVS